MKGVLTCVFLDIDECSENNDCHADANCTDTVGSYICSCKEGYSGNGFNCDGKPFITSGNKRYACGFTISLSGEIMTVDISSFKRLDTDQFKSLYKYL